MIYFKDSSCFSFGVRGKKSRTQNKFKLFLYFNKNEKQMLTFKRIPCNGFYRAKWETRQLLSSRFLANSNFKGIRMGFWFVGSFFLIIILRKLCYIAKSNPVSKYHQNVNLNPYFSSPREKHDPKNNDNSKQISANAIQDLGGEE